MDWSECEKCIRQTRVKSACRSVQEPPTASRHSSDSTDSTDGVSTTTWKSTITAPGPTTRSSPRPDPARTRPLQFVRRPRRSDRPAGAQVGTRQQASGQGRAGQRSAAMHPAALSCTTSSPSSLSSSHRRAPSHSFLPTVCPLFSESARRWASSLQSVWPKSVMLSVRLPASELSCFHFHPQKCEQTVGTRQGNGLSAARQNRSRGAGGLQRRASPASARLLDAPPGAPTAAPTGGGLELL